LDEPELRPQCVAELIEAGTQRIVVERGGASLQARCSFRAGALRRKQAESGEKTIGLIGQKIGQERLDGLQSL
jgi:hypothetical protein